MSTPFAIDPAWATTVLLLSLRLGATLAATPLLAPASVPVEPVIPGSLRELP